MDDPSFSRPELGGISDGGRVLGGVSAEKCQPVSADPEEFEGIDVAL